MTRSHLVFGLTFVGLGALLLLDQAGVVVAGAAISGWWPAIVVLAGVAQLVTRPRNLLGGGFLVLVGAALLLRTLEVVDTLALLWPTALIAVGLWLLTRPLRRRTETTEFAGETFVLFGDRRERAPAGPLAGRAVTTIFGDVDLDLQDTTLDGRATLQLMTIFGDVDVHVPSHWTVTVSGPEIFGDVTVPQPPVVVQGAPVLHLEVLTVFGDVTVRHASVPHGGRTDHRGAVHG